jgi:hypothetical protein
VQQILSDESTYGWRSGSLCAPTYAVLFTARSQDEVIRIALCFRCSQIGVFDTADGNSRHVNREDNFGGAGGRMLVALTKQLFPDDPEIQKIK